MNIRALLKRNKSDTRFIRRAILEENGLLYDRTFWRPILYRTLVIFFGAMAIVIAVAVNQVSLKLIRMWM